MILFSQVLSEEELQRIFEGCDMALELNELKLKIYTYVESRMQFIAPNMSIIVGAATAAKLMGKQNECSYVNIKFHLCKLKILIVYLQF